MTLREILVELRHINALDYSEYQTNYTIYTKKTWKGNLRYSGIKRMIYSLWHNGMNELGQPHPYKIGGEAIQAFNHLCSRVVDTPMPSLWIGNTNYNG
ncbi:hypothetical protein GCM10028806_34550 [Spirosoma terrae]